MVLFSGTANFREIRLLAAKLHVGLFSFPYSAHALPFLFTSICSLSRLFFCVLLSPSFGLFLADEQRPCKPLHHPHTGRVGGSPSPVPCVLAGWHPTPLPGLYSRPVGPRAGSSGKLLSERDYPRMAAIVQNTHIHTALFNVDEDVKWHQAHYNTIGLLILRLILYKARKCHVCTSHTYTSTNSTPSNHCSTQQLHTKKCNSILGIILNLQQFRLSPVYKL